MLVHGACGKEFKSTHCGSCHANFTKSQVAFDAHRIHSGKHAWTCVPEFLFATLGLRFIGGEWGFHTVEGVEARKAHAARMREAKSGGAGQDAEA